MTEWKEYKLGEIVTFQRGHDLPKDKMIDGDIPVAGSNGIIGYHNQFTKEGPGVTIGRSGNIGIPHYYPNAYWAHNTVLYIVDFKGNDAKFMYYLLKTFDFTQLNTGSAVPSLNRNHIHELPVSIPDVPTQCRIAAILSSLDDKIDLLHRENATLEQMAETLFHQWFVVEAKEEWEEKPLSFFGKIVCGKTPPKKEKKYFGGQIPFIKIPDMHNNVFVFNSEDTLTEEGVLSQKEKTIPPFSIIVSCIATVGLVVMNAKKAQTNQQINSIIPEKEYYRYFLFLHFRNMYEELNAMASGGTATLNLNTGNFSKILLPCPTDDYLRVFNEQVKDLFLKIYSNQKQIQTLIQTRDGLLPRLMGGEVKL